MDPSWYPLKFGDREANITAFSTELLSMIGSKEDISITKISVSWDDLMEGLQKGEYEAILSSMPPYLFNQKEFDFSSIYLPLGPVFMVKENSSLHSIDDLKGKEVGVVSGSTDDILIQDKSGVIIRYYDSIPAMLNALASGQIDGAITGILPANAYIQDLYKNELKIISPPLTEEGLRLVTLHNQGKTLLKAFNKGLEALKKDGSYEKMLTKWSISINYQK
ncbi:MAG: hypothetical protein RLZZ453_960 [Chlamydiota bacterium]